MKLSSELKDFVADQVSKPGRGSAFLEEARQALREKAKADYWWFCRWCCRFEDIDNSLHHELCYVWERRRQHPYSLWLVPRKHLKTTLLTIGDTLFEAINNSDIMQFVGSATLQLSTDMVTELKRDILEGSELFQWLFPEYCHHLAPRHKRDACRYTQYAVDWPARTRFKKEPSLTVTAVEHSMTSKHFDLLRFDDMVDGNNCENKEQRDKVYNWFKNCWQLRRILGGKDGSRIRLIGTRWHFDDVYGREIKAEQSYREDQVMQGVTKVKPRMLMYRRQVVESKEEGELPSPIWKERFPLEEIDKLKAQLPNYIFSCQWMNNPVSPEEAVFKLEDIRRIWDADLHTKALNNFMAVDFALTDKTSSDATVVTACSMDEEGKLYVREIYRKRTTNLDEVLDTIFRMCKKWNAVRVVVETQLFQEAVVKEYKKKAFSRGIYIPWAEVKRKKSKFARWVAMQPIVQNGDFYITQGIENDSHLLDEMTSLTPDHMPAHDDILDTVADCYQAAYNTPAPATVQMPPDSCEAVFTKLFGPMWGDRQPSRRRAWIGFD